MHCKEGGWVTHHPPPGYQVTFLSKRSRKLDDVQDGAMVERLLIIMSPNCARCLMPPLSAVLVPLCMFDVFLQINIDTCGRKLMP